MPRPIPALAMLMLASCGSAPREPPPWLAGRWATADEGCNAAWLVYGEDGTWRSRTLAGRWTLEGNSLRRVATHSRSAAHYFDPRKPGWTPLPQPLCHSEILTREGDGALSSRWQDGTVKRLHRCPGGRGKAICVGDCEREPFDYPSTPASPPPAARPCQRSR